MLGRKAALAVVSLVFVMVTFVAVSWPRNLEPHGPTVPSNRLSQFLQTVPTIAPPPTINIPAPEPTTTTPPTTVVVKGSNGRHLSVGFAPPAATPTVVADAKGSEVPLFSYAGEDQPDDWLDNPTWEGLPVVFIVHERQGDWLHVQVSMRPNQAMAWVRAADVTTRTVTSHIVIDTGARTLTAYDGNKVTMKTSVAPGMDDTPTPTGEFFVDGIVQPADDSGPYGPYQVSVAGFSNVYTSFGGGVGQIAIHGTNDPALIGQPASHGCVRMDNADITKLVTMISLGTPVRIV